MELHDVPIIRKLSELYKVLTRHRGSVPVFDRHGIWKACESAVLDTLKSVLLASQAVPEKKNSALEEASMQLNLLRVLLRLAWETKCIDNKKVAELQTNIDETGRMLGGWIRSLRKPTEDPPPEEDKEEVPGGRRPDVVIAVIIPVPVVVDVEPTIVEREFEPVAIRRLPCTRFPPMTLRIE